MSRGQYAAATVLLCVAAAAGIVVLLVADSWDVATNLTYAGLGLLVLGLTAAVGMSATGSSWAWLGWLCVAVAVAAFGILMGAIWSIGEVDEGNIHLFNAAGTLVLFSFALAYAVLVLSRWGLGPDGVLGAVVAGTLLAVLATATLFSIAIITEAGGETYFRVVAVVAVLGALGTGLIPLLRGLRRPA